MVKSLLPTQEVIEQAAAFGLDIPWAIEQCSIDNCTGLFINSNRSYVMNL
jgi:hypothetical protein